MPLYFDLTQPSGEVARIELKPGLQRIRVVPGDRYRILDERGEPPPGLLVRRYENHLLVDDAAGTIKVELSDYYGRCSVSSPCILEVGETGGQPVLVTPATEPIQALTDGSFVLYQGGSGVGPLATAAPEGGEGLSTGWIVGGLVGGLALAALAGGGGGGGDSQPTGVSPSPPAPVPPAPPPSAVDTTAPAQPQLTSAKEATTTRPVLSGVAEAGATVRVAFDTNRDGTSEAVFDTIAGADGQWQLDLASARPATGALPGGVLPDGARTAVTVVAIDASANVSEAQRFDLTVDTRAPEAPRITGVRDDSGARVGDIASGGGTDDLTPTVRGALGEALGPGERLVVLRNGVQIAAQPTVTGLDWQVTDAGLALGQTYVYEARVVDGLGVASPASNGWQVVARADPVPTAQITAVTDNVARFVGPVPDGGASNDRTPTITGSLSQALGSGESVQLLRNGVATAVAPSVSGTTFSFTDSLSADGRYTYAVRVVTAAGAGAATAGPAIVLDTANAKTAIIGAVVDNTAPSTGTVRDGGTTDDTTPTLRGTVSGGLAVGETLEILRDGAVVGDVKGTGAAAWEFTDGGLAIDRYSYSVRVVDAAGNVGRESGNYDIRVVLSTRDLGDADGPMVDPSSVITLGALLDAGEAGGAGGTAGGAAAGAPATGPSATSGELDRLIEAPQA